MRTEIEVWINANEVDFMRDVIEWYVENGLLYIWTKTEEVFYILENIQKFILTK